MSILRKIVVDVEVNTKESIGALNKLSQATKSYREDTKVFKEFSKEQGKSLGLYKQQMDMVDSYKKKVQELKKAKEEELKAYEEGIKKTYGKDRTELTIGDVESKQLANYAKELDNITKKTAKYTEELSKTEAGSKEYQQTVDKMNKLDEERTDIIKRSQIEADIAYNSMQSNLRTFEVDIDKHDSELGKLGRTYDNLRNSADAFSDSIRRQGDALKGANASQYKKELQDIEKQHEQSMKTRRDSYNTIFNTADRVGTGIVAATSLSGAAAVAGTQAINKYVDHNYNELDVMRMARGNEEQNAKLRASLDKTLRENHESNAEIFGLYHELIKHVDPSEYGDKLQDMVQTALDLSLAGDQSTADAVGMMVKINKVTGREIGDASLFHGANELQNQFGVDLGNVLQVINTSASRLSNAGWEDPDILTLAGMGELLWARGNESAARGLAEMGEMMAMATYDTSEFEKLQSFAGKNFNSKEIIDFMKGYDNQFINNLEAQIDESGVNIDLKKAKAEAEAYQLKMDIMNSYGLTTTAELNDLLESTSMGDIFIQLLKGLEKLTADGRTMAEVSETRGYMPNNAITQESMNNIFKIMGEFDEFRDAVTTGMEEGTSLTDEAKIFRESDKAQLELLKKEVGFLIIDIGKSLTPALLNLLENLDPIKDFIIGIVDWIAELKPETIETALKGMLVANVGGWGLKTVGFAGQTAFQVSELGEMIGNVTGKNSKRSITKARDVAREEASLVKDLVDAMVSDDVSKGVKPLSLDEYTNISKQYVKVKGDEVKITKEAAELIGKQKDSMSKLVDVVDSVDDVGDVVSDASSTIRKTATDTAGIVSNLDDVVTKNTVSIGGKFKTFLASLSPLTKVALAVGAIAATSYAAYKINEYLMDKADEDRNWGKDSTVDEETRAKYEEAAEETKRLRFELRQLEAKGEGTTLSTEKLSDLDSYRNEMIDITQGQIGEWSEWLDDDVMKPYAQSVVDKMEENKVLLGEYGAIIEEALANNGVLSKEQLARLASIDETVANNLDKSEGGDGSISNYITNSQLLSTMDNKERKEEINKVLEDISTLEKDRDKELQKVEAAYLNSLIDDSIPTMDEQVYKDKMAEINKKYSDLIIPKVAEADYLEKNTWWVNPFKVAKIGDLSGEYSGLTNELIANVRDNGGNPDDLLPKFGETIEKLKRISETIKTIRVDDESKKTKSSLFTSLFGLEYSADFLLTVDKSRVAVEAFSSAIDEVGSKDFYSILPELLGDEEFKAVWEGMNTELATYVEGLESLDQLTATERTLYLASNLTEKQIEIMNTKNLWESEPFTERLLGVMLRDGDVTKAIESVKTEVDANGQTIIIDADIVNAQRKLDSLKRNISQLSSMGVDTTYVTRNTRVSRVSNHALGTNYHPGGMAILGDGFEPELVFEPGKAPYLSEMVPTKYNLSRGTVVIPYSKIPEVKNVNPPLYNEGVGSMSSVTGDTYNHEITVNAYTDNVDVELIKREMTKFIRDEELNKRRIKVSGGES